MSDTLKDLKAVDKLKAFVDANVDTGAAGKSGTFYISGDIKKDGAIVVRNADINWGVHYSKVALQEMCKPSKG